MRSVKRLLAGGLFFGAVFFIGSANAAEISFDGAAGALSLKDYISSAAPDLPRLTSAAPAAGAHVYDFKTLYAGLGYPSPGYFGSSAEEVEDLGAYTSKEDAFYKEINGYLRYYPAPYEWYGTGPEDAKLIVGCLDNIFARTPSLPGDLVLFRGLGLGYRQNKPFALGEEFIDKGYVSTSVTYSVARHFAVEMSGEGNPSGRAILTFYFARPGEKGILVDQGEDEIILPHGHKFRVMGKKAGIKKYDLYLVQVCAAACDTTVRGDVKDFWEDFSARD